MLDQDTARALLTIADEAGARVALVGDRHQLPAVGRGGVLDLAHRWVDPDARVDLDTVHRFVAHRRRHDDRPGQRVRRSSRLAMRAGDEPGAVFDALHAARPDRASTAARPSGATRSPTTRRRPGSTAAAPRRWWWTPATRPPRSTRRSGTGSSPPARSMTAASPSPRDGQRIGAGDRDRDPPQRPRPRRRQPRHLDRHPRCTATARSPSATPDRAGGSCPPTTSASTSSSATPSPARRARRHHHRPRTSCSTTRPPPPPAYVGDDPRPRGQHRAPGRRRPRRRAGAVDRRVRPGPGRPRTRRRRPRGRPRRGRLPPAPRPLSEVSPTLRSRVDRPAHRAPAPTTPRGTPGARPGAGRLGGTLPTGPRPARDRARRRAAPRSNGPTRPPPAAPPSSPHRAEHHAAALRQAWDTQLVHAEHAARTIAAGPGRLGIHRGRVRDAQQHLDTWTATVVTGVRRQRPRPATSSRPGRSSSGSHVQRVTDALDEHARRLAAADHPDARRPATTPPSRPATGTTRPRLPTTRPAANLQQRSHLPVYDTGAAEPAPRAHRTGRGRAAPRPIPRPADRAAHHRPGDHQPPRPAGAAPARPAPAGPPSRQPPTSTRRPERPARSDRSGTTRPRSTHVDHGPSLGR